MGDGGWASQHDSLLRTSSMIKGCLAQNGGTALIEKLVFSFYSGLKIDGEMYL